MRSGKFKERMFGLKIYLVLKLDIYKNEILELLYNLHNAKSLK